MKTGDLTDLRRSQELFWELIAAPEGARRAVQELRRRGDIDEGAIEGLFQGDAGLPALERLDIYANMYFYRLLDCLAEDYPHVLAAIGPPRFHNLVTDYLLRHPSESPSLRHLGHRLPEFLAAHPLSGEVPWIADLARLEWARADLFDAADAAPLSRDDLARLPQERAGEARLTLIPAFALLKFEHDVVPFWRRLEDLRSGGSGALPARATGNAAREGREDDESAHTGWPAAVTPPLRKRKAARVWRRDFIVYHRGIDADEVLCLERLQEGESLERICQGLAAGRSAGRATERAGRMIQVWLDDGILAGVTLPAPA